MKLFFTVQNENELKQLSRIIYYNLVVFFKSDKLKFCSNKPSPLETHSLSPGNLVCVSGTAQCRFISCFLDRSIRLSIKSLLRKNKGVDWLMSVVTFSDYNVCAKHCIGHCRNEFSKKIKSSCVVAAEVSRQYKLKLSPKMKPNAQFVQFCRFL